MCYWRTVVIGILAIVVFVSVDATDSLSPVGTSATLPGPRRATEEIDFFEPLSSEHVGTYSVHFGSSVGNDSRIPRVKKPTRVKPKPVVPTLELVSRRPGLLSASPETKVSPKLRTTSNAASRYVNGLGAEDCGADVATPPDQALCVGNGFVIEMVNDLMQIRRSADFLVVTPTVLLHNFFNAPAPVIMSDPNCLWDTQSKRFVATILGYTATIDALTSSYLFIAVSSTSDPRGRWSVHRINTFGLCRARPCLDDFPQLSSDSFNWYLTTNVFYTDFFNMQWDSGRVWAFPKSRNLGGGPLFGRFANLHEEAFTSRVASAPPLSPGWTRNGGAAFVVYVYDSNPAIRGMAVRAIVYTSSIASQAMRLSNRVVVPISTFNEPPPMAQSNPAVGQCNTFQNRNPLDSGGLRVGLSSYVNGRLHIAFPIDSGSSRSAIQYVVLRPSLDAGGRLTVTSLRQTTLQMTGHSLSFPSIALNRLGQGIMAFSLVGDSYFPSGAYVRLDNNGPISSNIVVFAPGSGAYYSLSEVSNQFQPNWAVRWQDYSAAVVEGDDNAWAAVEFIPSRRICFNRERNW
eukprot:CAMPEP_0184671564 /NCGR_PEP_ID=MMETSP0308-20130426/85580_1 /TAXON_ID=38269 /ORGANISM="Gloeochaete witrockiana, Strain SAG 46.84" /LENGTH=571 /DNA_ID=CAMNT_0027118725 /DNA_START=77 /DNA_END=1789 /DNA_ORIENTATION=-